MKNDRGLTLCSRKFLAKEIFTFPDEIKILSEARREISRTLNHFISISHIPMHRAKSNIKYQIPRCHCTKSSGERESPLKHPEFHEIGKEVRFNASKGVSANVEEFYERNRALVLELLNSQIHFGHFSTETPTVTFLLNQNLVCLLLDQFL